MRILPASPHNACNPSLCRGFTLVVVLILVATAAVMALVLTPGVNIRARDQAKDEDQRLQSLAQALRRSVRQTQTIPGTATWVQTIADSMGSDPTHVQQVFPLFATETQSRRVYVIDPRFRPRVGGATLPFTQPAAGLDPLGANTIPNVYARVMIVSSSRRGLALPFGSGNLAQARFDGLWDWVYSPANLNPPLASYSTAWRGHSADLHVARVEFESMFHLLTFRKLGYSANGGTTQWVSNTVTRYFLEGTDLRLFALTNGLLAERHVVERDAKFDLSGGLRPIGYWDFNESLSATVVTNLGYWGSTANASLTNGAALTVSTLKAPTYAGYASNNISVSTDGVSQFLDTHVSLLNSLSQFTLACWIKPGALPVAGPQAIAGQFGVVELGFISGSNLRVQTGSGGLIQTAYSYPSGQWHHVAVTGDGLNLRLYVDGVLIFTGGNTVSGGSYGTSTSAFRMGGGGIFSASGNYFQGEIDEVCVFDEALDANQLSGLVVNQFPN